MLPLDRNGNIPLVHQRGEAIREKIVWGEYNRGEADPDRRSGPEILWRQSDHGATRSPF
jgi:hypothetical protein